MTTKSSSICPFFQKGDCVHLNPDSLGKRDKRVCIYNNQLKCPEFLKWKNKQTKWDFDNYWVLREVKKLEEEEYDSQN
jgi:hypothetical protein